MSERQPDAIDDFLEFIGLYRLADIAGRSRIGTYTMIAAAWTIGGALMIAVAIGFFWLLTPASWHTF